MTNNMERIRFEIVRALITCFPKDYIEMVFVGGVSALKTLWSDPIIINK